MINQEYIEFFSQSLQSKDLGLMKSSLEHRSRGTQLVANSEGHFALARANEVTLLAHHIGDGTEAYSAVQDCLKRLEAFFEYDAEWKKVTGLSPARDTLQYGAISAKSFDENIKLLRLLADYGLFESAQMQREIGVAKEAEQKGRSWWSCQRKLSQMAASRESPQNNQGMYPLAMSILDCILERGQNGDPGYEMTAEELFDVLDDSLMFSLLAYEAINRKFNAAVPKDSPLRMGVAAEQFILFKKPLERWHKLMSDCPAKWRPTFAAYYAHFVNSPHPIYPQLMKRIGENFRDVDIETRRCPKCGFTNSVLSEACIMCRNPLKKADKKPLLSGIFGRR